MYPSTAVSLDFLIWQRQLTLLLACIRRNHIYSFYFCRCTSPWRWFRHHPTSPNRVVTVEIDLISLPRMPIFRRSFSAACSCLYLCCNWLDCSCCYREGIVYTRKLVSYQFILIIAEEEKLHDFHFFFLGPMKTGNFNKITFLRQKLSKVMWLLSY